MKAHWSAVRETMSLLNRVMCNQEKGVEILFSRSGGHPQVGRSDVLEHFENCPLQTSAKNTMPGLRKALASRLRQYLAGRQQKKATIFVLTDGNWAKEEQFSISRMVSEFRQLRRDPTALEKLSIQFVQFGNDSAKTVRLNRQTESATDCKIGQMLLRAVDYDFVSTVPASGGAEAILKAHAKLIESLTEQQRGTLASSKAGLVPNYHFQKPSRTNPTDGPSGHPSPGRTATCKSVSTGLQRPVRFFEPIDEKPSIDEGKEPRSITNRTGSTSTSELLKQPYSGSKVLDLPLRFPSSVSSVLSTGKRVAERMSESFHNYATI